MSDSKETPLPKDQIIFPELEKDGYTICPYCLSAIEILNIKEENNEIEYRCIEEEKVYTMSIKEYLRKIDEMKNKNIEVIKDKCDIHNNNKYVCYCLDCKYHLCNECLKTRKHINHRKSNIIEIKPREEEKEIIEEVIRDYDKKLNEIKLEKEAKEKDYEEKKNKEKRREEKKLEEENKINERREKDDINECKNTYKKNIENIRKKYENEMKLERLEYEKKVNNIKNKYKLINEKERIKTGILLEKIEIKYTNIINEYEFEKKIENYEKMLRINKMIFNIYNNYNNNYYNSLNINSLLIYYINTRHINDNIVKIKLKDKYDEIVNIINRKKNEDKKMKEKDDKKYKEIDELKKKVSIINNKL